ncbi:trypsin-like serine protease [Flavihumibacter solisilvae]|uniref:Peptidase S1 domain-containing protein n=1 Tax=Flavihumibacter solisilvae TaxID=1349421 RepID=A0A0C1L5W6_9BACT|nr:trypsin-like serine protease [Flavihumibacter solisilvae]KIC95492.1 hypothetical protein OI18_06340 [Flavihumibacter solisilvae]
MNSKTKQKLDAIQRHINREFNRWNEKYPNIIGAYPGKKIREGAFTGRYAIVFMVSDKQLDPSVKIPRQIKVRIPGEGSKLIPTDVVKKDRFKLLGANLSDNIERIGSDISGTNGVFLIKGSNVFACSNAHVLNPKMLQNGLTHFVRPKEEQLQPDVRLSNSRGERFNAFLQEAFFGKIDIAVARMDEPGNVDNRIPGFGKPTGIKIISQANRGLKVTMIGGISGKQSGMILNVGVSQPVEDTGFTLQNLIEADFFSDHGDSGSPVFADPLKIIGIVVGGRNGLTYIIPIDKILSAFKLDLLK